MNSTRVSSFELELLESVVELFNVRVSHFCHFPDVSSSTNRSHSYTNPPQRGSVTSYISTLTPLTVAQGAFRVHVPTSRDSKYDIRFNFRHKENYYNLFSSSPSATPQYSTPKPTLYSATVHGAQLKSQTFMG